MRILYGAFAQGQGHFSKAAVLVPLLESRGHVVRVISSGGEQPPAGYHFTWHRHFPGLSYVVRNGQTQYGDSLRSWLTQIPRLLRHLMTIRGIVREFEPEIVISDFEPLTASPVIEPRCEVVAMSRQVALFDPQVPLPSEMAWERKMTRTVIRIFTAGADRHYGYHYSPASLRCVPPAIRCDLVGTERGDEGHIVVYNVYQTSGEGSADLLVEWAKRRKMRVRAYGFPGIERGHRGPVEFKAPSREGILNDMATSRGVMTSAGITTPIEGFLLRKPVCTVPISGQWEQCVNAFHLQEAKLASWSRTWDYDRLLETPVPSADHALNDWLSTPVERILDHVLDGSPLVAGKVAAAA